MRYGEIFSGVGVIAGFKVENGEGGRGVPHTHCSTVLQGPINPCSERDQRGGGRVRGAAYCTLFFRFLPPLAAYK